MPVPMLDQGVVWLIFVPFIAGLTLYPSLGCLTAFSQPRFYFASLVALLFLSGFWLGWLAEVPLFFCIGCYSAIRVREIGLYVNDCVLFPGSVVTVLLSIPALFLTGAVVMRSSLCLFSALKRSRTEMKQVLRCSLNQLLILMAAAAVSFFLGRFQR